MALVKMSNLLGQSIRVPRGAVKSYQGLGFKEDGVEASATEVMDKVDENGEDDKDLTEDEMFVMELEKKPLAQWNKDEVKSYAAIRGVDLAGTKNAQEAKERIKAYIDSLAE